jgi:chemotaxis signal transduction protein
MTAPKEATERAQYLTFSVAEEEYGVSIVKVREILEYGTVTRVPRTPEHVRGVINLRGRVVPVVDLAVRLGLPASAVTSRSCVVIVEVKLDGDDVVMGIMADAVSQVIELGSDEIEPPPSFGTRLEVGFLHGMGRAGRGFVLLLDIDRLLSAGETEELAALTASPEAEAEAEAPEAPAAGGAGGVVATALLALLLGAAAVGAQDEPIADNSFLIEEAYNQESGVVQHINAFSRDASSGDWVYTFTQEWPLHGLKHQISYSLPVQDVHSPLAAAVGIGDIALNYRYQAAGAERIAFAPRISLLVPTGESKRGLGAGGVGVQLNLPVSWAWGSRLVTHWNAGYTHTYSARDEFGDRADTNAINLGQSVVWLAHPRFNVLLETVYTRAQAVAGERKTETSDALFVSPGIRWAYNFSNGLQIVPGVAFPIGVGPSSGDHGFFLYLSFEHPFRKSKQAAQAPPQPPRTASDKP